MARKIKVLSYKINSGQPEITIEQIGKMLIPEKLTEDSRSAAWECEERQIADFFPKPPDDGIDRYEFRSKLKTKYLDQVSFNWNSPVAARVANSSGEVILSIKAFRNLIFSEEAIDNAIKTKDIKPTLIKQSGYIRVSLKLRTSDTNGNYLPRSKRPAFKLKVKIIRNKKGWDAPKILVGEINGQEGSCSFKHDGIENKEMWEVYLYDPT
jgi:hypothetical protein